MALGSYWTKAKTDPSYWYIFWKNYACSTERLIASLVDKYCKHPVLTDGGTWYSQACQFLKLKNHFNSFFEKSIIERTMQYIKNWTEYRFDDYFPCKRMKCNLKHVSGCIYSLINTIGKYYLKLTEPINTKSLS